MRTPVRRLVPALLAGLAFGMVCPSLAAAAGPDPCEGLLLKDGEVRTARRLLAREDLGPQEQACVQAIGAALAGQGGVRSVTVSVRLADPQRAAGLGPRVGTLYTRLLTAGGLPAARVSNVVPAAAHGQEGLVTVTYLERRSDRPVARLDTADGAVRTGGAEAALQPAKRGDMLNPETWVETAPGAAAWLELADGSRLHLGPGTLLFVGRLYLNESLRRVVKLDLKRGQVEADVRSGGQGSTFEISTQSTVAGVRGTKFRLTADGDSSRLETLSGTVVLAGPPAADGKPSETPVTAGQGAQVARASETAQAAALLDAPTIDSPRTGPAKAGTPLKFSAVEGATGYRVELARDAEFSYEVRTLSVAAPGTGLPADLPAGTWFWRIAALDRAGFQGRPSKIYAFDVGAGP